ncbi:MAG: methionine--tRNA ligase [Candidatus Kapaibacterium sp.]|jgi:methionyl-tRNA synthetase
MKRTLITSALPYANGYIHLGHLAGAYLPADIYARFLRLLGEEVLYVCGSDEHGVAITISAEKENTTPQAIIDKYHNANADAFKKFGMSFDIYSRTSNNLHKETALDFFEVLLEKKFLEEKEEEQFYDSKAKMFLPDRYIEGICPNCNSDKARGDQCDKCGAYYEQNELKNPISTITGTTPTLKKTTHWYLKLGMFQDFVESYMESNEKFWKDNVLQQAKGWLRLGLNDRAITRDLDWGVKIENAKGINKEKAAGKVLYVWFDAVLGYLTATKEWALREESRGKVTKDDWKKWWKDEETSHIAFIGKDNIVFHTIMLPVIQIAYGGFILPTNVPANEFLNLEGNKFSKSRNWSIDLKDFIDDFESEQSIDTLRYTLATILPENKDSDFTWKDFQAKNNNELAAILGNFINRTVQFIHKYMGGRVPILTERYANIQEHIERIITKFSELNIKSPDELKKLYKEENVDELSINDFLLFFGLWRGLRSIENLYKKFKFKDAVAETMNLARVANKYFNDEEPWKAIKENPEKCHKTIYICSQVAYTLAIAFAPILPYTSAKLQTLLGKEINIGNANAATKGANYFHDAIKFNVKSGLQLPEVPVLFEKIEDDVIAKQIAKLGNEQQTETKAESKKEETKKAEAEKPAKTEKQVEEVDDGMISIDYFSKVKLRTAKIIQADRIEKSKKLLKLIVKMGDEERQILAGVADSYEPEYLVGKTIVVVSNLRPTKLMGLDSEGMMLCASKAGKLCFVTTEVDFEDDAYVR